MYKGRWHDGFRSVDNIIFIRQRGSFQHFRVGHGYIGAGDMLNRCIHVIESVFVNQRRQALARSVVFPSFLGDDDAIGFLDRVDEQVDIDGADTPEIDDFCFNAFFSQVGLILMIALASKNAILVVEFARDLHKEGMSITEAAIEATHRRFRPIVMTSFAFILGVAPLVVAFGAGSASQRAIGTVVFGGMLSSTLLAIPFVPVFYVLMERLSERLRKGKGSPLPKP